MTRKGLLITKPIGIELILCVPHFCDINFGLITNLESPCQSSSPLPPAPLLRKEKGGRGEDD